MNVCYVRELFNQFRELMPEVFGRCASALEDSGLDNPRHCEAPSDGFSNNSGSLAKLTAIRRAMMGGWFSAVSFILASTISSLCVRQYA